MASLIKRGERFYLEIYDARRSPRRKTVRIRVRTRRHAEAVRAEIERAYALGEYNPWKTPQWPPVEPPASSLMHASVSLSEASAAFLRTKVTLRKATRDHYRWVLDAFATSVVADPPVSMLDHSHMADWLGASGLSDHSVHTYWKTLKVFLKWLECQGIPVHADGFSVSRPCEKLSRKLITPAQVGVLIGAARQSSSPYMASVIVVTYQLALRLGEVCALRWGWIDFSARLVRIQSSEGFRTKTGATVVKPITSECARALSHLDAGNPDEHVITNTKGNPLTAKYTSKQFKKLVRLSGLPESITFHGLRHGSLSLAAANGASIEAIRQFAGHASMAITERYVHLNQDAYTREIRSALDSGPAAQGSHPSPKVA